MSFIDKLKNKISDASKLVLIDTADSEKRLEICKACPHLIQATTQCAKCGCFMVAKTKLKSSSCPINKW